MSSRNASSSPARARASAVVVTITSSHPSSGSLTERHQPGRKLTGHFAAAAVSQSAASITTQNWRTREHREQAGRRDPRPGLGPGAGVGGVVHGRAGPAGRRDRAEHDPPRPGRLDRGTGVDGQRLHAGLRGAADDRGRRGRPVRQAAGLRHWPGRVRRGLGGVRARARGRRADRGARCAGRRRGDGHAAGAGAAERGRPGAAPRLGDGHLRLGNRPGGRGGAGTGRRDHPGHRLAVDLLAERADRPDYGHAGAAPPRRELRPSRRTGPARRGAGHRRGARAGVGPGARHLGLLTAPRPPGRSRPGRRWPWRSSAGTAGPGADAADALFATRGFSPGTPSSS